MSRWICTMTELHTVWPAPLPEPCGIRPHDRARLKAADLRRRGCTIKRRHLLHLVKDQDGARSRQMARTEISMRITTKKGPRMISTSLRRGVRRRTCRISTVLISCSSRTPDILSNSNRCGRAQLANPACPSPAPPVSQRCRARNHSPTYASPRRPYSRWRPRCRLSPPAASRLTMHRPPSTACLTPPHP